MRGLKLLLMGLLLLEGMYFLFDQTTGIVVETPVIRDDALAAIFGQARLAQISDLHIARFGLIERKLLAVIDRVDPDVVFVTGDLVSGNAGIDACAGVFRKLASGRTVIAILGNNDHSCRQSHVDTGRLVRRLKASGAHVLVNESLRVAMRPDGGVKGKDVYVVGVDDSFTWRDDIFRATVNVPAGAKKVLLAHAPNIVERIHTEDICLILSGHTHGGQIALPFFGALYTNPTYRSRRKLVAGFYADDTNLYVNRGIGTGMIHLRVFARPEVTVFRFVPEDAGGIKNR